MESLKKVILVLILLVIGYFLLPYVKVNPKTTDQNSNQDSSKPSSDPLAGKVDGTKLYISDKLGVRFTYDPAPSETMNITVTEKDNKIYVHSSKEAPETGQSLEVFSKDSNISLEDAIKKQFLQGFDPKDCYTRTYSNTEQLRLNYTAAGITYPAPTNPDDPGWQNADKCPANYSETNAVQYFVMNKDVPSKFVFARIGQYSLTSDGAPMTDEGGFNWSHSIEIFK